MLYFVQHPARLLRRKIEREKTCVFKGLKFINEVTGVFVLMCGHFLANLSNILL